MRFRYQWFEDDIGPKTEIFTRELLWYIIRERACYKCEYSKRNLAFLSFLQSHDSRIFYASISILSGISDSVGILTGFCVGSGCAWGSKSNSYGSSENLKLRRPDMRCKIKGDCKWDLDDTSVKVDKHHGPEEGRGNDKVYELLSDFLPLTPT